MYRFTILVVLFVTTVQTSFAQQQTAHVQIIHASADPSIPALDVWMGEERVMENFELGDATPFLDIPADSSVVILLFPARKSPEGIPYMETTVRGGEGNGYAVILTGLVNESDFLRNPEGWYTFFIFRQVMGLRHSAASPNLVDLQPFHSVTDAPGIDLIDHESGELAGQLQYGIFNDYFSVMPNRHTITLKRAQDPNIEYGTFDVDLRGKSGLSAILVFTGFLDPALNKNGRSMGLYLIFSDGTVERPASVTSVKTLPLADEPELDVYPSPIATYATVTYNLNTSTEVHLLVYNNTGTRVISRELGAMNRGAYSTVLDASALDSGIYRVVVATDDRQISKHVMVIR